MSGKGSGRRPGEGYEEAHARIFGEKKRERYVPPPITPPRSAEEVKREFLEDCKWAADRLMAPLLDIERNYGSELQRFLDVPPPLPQPKEKK